MHAAVLADCLPYLIAILLSVVFARLLLSVCSTRFRFSHLRNLHADERGAVQSLSFVLTLPIFVMLMLFVIQLSQLTIARMTVEYSAYAAARSAIVWIPANLGELSEEPNCLGSRLPQGSTRDERGNEFDVYRLVGPSPKRAKIELAAAMALLAICPSRDVPNANSPLPSGAFASLEKAYRAMAPGSTSNLRVPTRLQNKLAYALANTEVGLEIRHRTDEPPLEQHYLAPYPDEFERNEIGWQDQVLVTVRHDFALLPGPARFLAKRLIAPGRTSDEVSDRVQRRGGVFVYPITATVRLSNEGEKSLLPYTQFANTPVVTLEP
jgi:hypothetical protein